MFATVIMQSVTASNLWPRTGDHFGTRNLSLTRFMRIKLKLIKVFEKHMKYQMFFKMTYFAKKYK